MTLDLPEGLRWLAWVAGTTWPDGDEDAAWAVSEAWKTASTDLKALLTMVDEAKRVTEQAYSDGEAAVAMGQRFDALRTGDQSLESLAEMLQTISDSAFDMGTQLQGIKITVIVSLAALALEILWAWLFPPTAPAVEAAAISTTRSFLRVFEDIVQNAITKLATKLGAPATKRYFWKTVATKGFAVPTAKGWGVYGVKFAEAAAISMAIDGSVQLGQMADGKRRHFNGTQFGLSVLASVAGTLPSREFARYLGRGIDKLAANQLNNLPGRVGRGAFIGASSGIVSSAMGNVAVGAATGDWASFTSGPGWVGGAARGGLVGGARGGFAKNTPISSADIRYGAWMHKPGQPRVGPPNPPAHHDGPAGVAGDQSSTHSGSDQSFVTAPQGQTGGAQSHSGTFGSEGTGGVTSQRPAVHTDGSAPPPGNSGVGPSTQPGGTPAHQPVGTFGGEGGNGGPPGSGSVHSQDGSESFVTAPLAGPDGQPVTTTASHPGGRPPTSWESSVDGGWQPPASSNGHGGAAVPPTPHGTSPGSSADNISVSSGPGSSYYSAPPAPPVNSPVHAPPPANGAGGQSIPAGAGTSAQTAGSSSHPPGGSHAPGGSANPPGASTLSPGSESQPGSSSHPPGSGGHAPGGSSHAQGGGANPPGGSSHPGGSHPPPGAANGGAWNAAGGGEQRLVGEPFLGPGKDMKAKTRPKSWPYWEPLPGEFGAPEAPEWGEWLPPGAYPAGEGEPGGESGNTDTPFTLGS
ncbi:hypothetical protein [Nocardia blacklockiae]|uniref:WXG100-like domain-containing protein n=1 Tax=Nocardia blacklockiae TaxID=480036 RepID=UPI0018940240|nr:hypothetical protein [Nocardia blacklockiae]MBF6171426.1 hypothetical protein [Nocardia blacklockiae]